MSRWKHKDPNVQAATPEKLRIEIDNVFKTFMDDSEATYHDFPHDLNNLQRKYIHDKARKLNLQSKSHGKEPNRILTIYKPKKLVNYESFYLNLSEESSNAINSLQHLNLNLLSGTKHKYVRKTDHEITFGRIQYLRPVHVKPANPSPLQDFRKTLPVFSMKNKLLNLIRNNRVVIVSSETGSGKTTQIPQFLLEDAYENGYECRIVCTQPRRISAVAVAERVAAERGEQVGATVGYSIRLESKMGPLTSLYYCTNGVLLRTLMHDEKSLFDITHVIVDEIHERDKFSDFLLIVLKAGLERNPRLRVILMSATFKTDIYETYFNCAVTCSIPGRTYSIKELFLDDILHMVKYESYEMSLLRRHRETGVDRQEVAAIDNLTLTDEIDVDMEEAVDRCVTCGTDDCFDHLMQLIVSEGANVNYRHSTSGCTGLMAAAMHGNIDMVERLVYLGADIHLCCAQRRTACDWAEYYSKPVVFELLRELGCQKPDFVQQSRAHPSQQLLEDYDKTISDEVIDYNLIISIIHYVHGLQQPGSVLVFLPGYDDIMQCQETILNSDLKMSDFVIFLLHGSMQIGAQHDVFNVIPGKRKIILSTNVAETSITIDDVVYVIDSGRAKEKTFDALSGIGALQTTWISKACAKQRAGRAGRTRDGICFHIYSKERFDSMQSNRTPEILRVSLHELCLHTKMLAPADMSIAEFLAQALEPPSSIAVQSSVQSLQALGALDANENLTNLGEHLLQISAEPHLAKMLIYSTILKCVDPVLTIVSCLAHKDPFVLPAQGKMKSVAQAKKKSLSFDSLSDHMSFIRAFQMWQDAKVKNMEKRFCREYFVSSATMEMILQTRVQLLGQLRAAGFVHPHHPDNIQNLNKFAESWPVVKAVLVVGLYPNLAYVQNKKIITRTEKRVAVHTSSCLSKYLDDSKRNVFHNWVVFEELSKTGPFCSIKCATVISPTVVALICGRATISETDGFSINIDDWLEFEPSNRDLYKFRQHLERTISKRITNPMWHLNNQENRIIDLLYEVLSAEDAVISLRHPEGVGQRPRFVQERETNISRMQQDCFYFRKKFIQNGFQACNGNPKPVSPRFSNGANSNVSFPCSSPRQPRSFTNGEASHNYKNRPKNDQPITRIFYFKVPAQERELSPNAEFYILKPNNVKSIDISIRQSAWLFSPQTERKVLKALHEGKEIILFYSVPSVAGFMGVARLLGTNEGCPSTPCPVKWLCRVDVPHQRTKHLLNPFTEYRPVYYCDDGQVVEPQVARELYNIFFQCNVPETYPRFRPILGGSA